MNFFLLSQKIQKDEDVESFNCSASEPSVASESASFRQSQSGESEISVADLRILRFRESHHRHAAQCGDHGDLLPLGRRQLRLLGRQFALSRPKLSEIALVDTSTMFVRATAYPRVIQSAYHFLMGFFDGNDSKVDESKICLFVFFI